MDAPAVSLPTILAHWLLRIIAIGLAVWGVGGYLSLRAAEFGIFDPRQLIALGPAQHVWPAVDLPTTGQRVREAGHEFIRGTNDQPGFFLYGPGLPILAGRYQLTISGRTSASTPVGIVQIAGAGGSQIIWSEELTTATFTTPISLDLPSLLDLEVRLAATTTNAVDIERITLTRSDIAWWQTIRELPEHLGTIGQRLIRRLTT